MARILVIDDDPVILKVITDILNSSGHEVATAPDGRAGIGELERDNYDLVITDLMMPEAGGIEVLDGVLAICPKTMCIIMTGYGSIKSSVEAIKKGAFDYITKPVSASELLVVVEKALKFRNLEDENSRLKKELRRKYRYDNIIGTSDAIKKIYELIDKVADTDGTILVSGPTGTGKELISKAIHYNSGRSEKPLVVINCGAIPEELLESELFGHEKGAFTGANKTRIGRFEMANGGTVFLDEIGEMSPALQVKLLRVLQERRFEKVGGTKSINVDVRIIAATNRDLKAAIKEGTFREDLYYRLNVIPIKVPSLASRKSDIPLLADFFLKKRQQGKPQKIKGLSQTAMDALMRYDWPGNVRELENVITRISILCDNQTAGFYDLPEYLQEGGATEQPCHGELLGKGTTLSEAVRDFEKRLILEALEKSDGVKAKAAKLLNIKRTTLVEKIKKQKAAEAG